MLEDLIEEHPAEALPRQDQGSVIFRTGDAVIDKWERELAEGKDIDFMEAFLPKDRDMVKRFMENREAFLYKKGRFVPPGFSDKYK